MQSLAIYSPNGKKKEEYFWQYYEHYFLNHFKCKEETCCDSIMGITAQFVCAKEILDMHQELEQHLLHRLTLTLVLPPFHPFQSKLNHLLIYGFHQDTWNPWGIGGWNQIIINLFLWLYILSFLIEQVCANICKTQKLKLTEKTKARGETCTTQEAKNSLLFLQDASLGSSVVDQFNTHTSYSQGTEVQG